MTALCLKLVPRGEETRCVDFRDRTCLVSGPACLGGGGAVAYGLLAANKPVAVVASAALLVNCILASRISMLGPWSALGRSVNRLGLTTRSLTDAARKLKETEEKLQKQAADFETQLIEANRAKEDLERKLQERLGQMTNLTQAMKETGQGCAALEIRLEGIVGHEEEISEHLGKLVQRQEEDQGALLQEGERFQRSISVLGKMVSSLRAEEKVSHEENERLNLLLNQLADHEQVLRQENAALQKTLEQIKMADAVQRRVEESLRELRALEAALQGGAQSREPIAGPCPQPPMR